MDCCEKGHPNSLILNPPKKVGLKNGNPIRWSQWACVNIRLRSLLLSWMSLFPSALIPLPASIMIISSFLDLISRQVVSPPYLLYSFPETGIDPREPQHLIYKKIPPHYYISAQYY
jgi:hypothetical protein